VKNIWVFDGPDWVAFPEVVGVEDLIRRSLSITYSGFQGISIEDKGQVDNGSWAKTQERGWHTWVWHVKIPGKETVVCKFRLYNLYQRADHL